MAESPEIHQIEYRWQRGRDMSPAASSMSPDSARGWYARIGPWVRPPGVDTPTASVRYEMFGTSGLAALAWRLRDRQPAGYEDGRPLVSRVLVGPASLLTPEVGVAVCHAGLPESVGPRPGTVEPGAGLAPADADQFAALASDNAHALDEAAAGEAGLARVIAAALEDRDTPLSVQLPERVISQTPRGGSQALLLWGLRRIVWPLIGHGGRRGWSFSTFELPQSDMDTGNLPDIVFREDQPSSRGAPLTVRKEIRVRPRDPVDPPPETLAQHLAKLLVVTYAELGGDELCRLITQHARGRSSAEWRLQAIYDLLDTRTSAVTVAGEQPPFIPVTTKPAEATQAAPATSAGAVQAAPTPASAPPRTPEPEPEPEPFQRPHASPVNPREYRAPAAPAQTSAPAESAPHGIPAKPVPRHRKEPPDPASVPVTASAPPVDQPPQPATSVPADTLTSLLDRLGAGPTSQGFEPALHALRAQNFQSRPADRAHARKLIREQSWYADVLRGYDQASPEDVLMVIFSRTVVPDLAYPQVYDEIADWACHQGTPDVVIKALYAAADGAADTQQRMAQTLGPALAWRWQAEHGFYGPVAVPAATVPSGVTEPVFDTDTGGARATETGPSAHGTGPAARDPSGFVAHSHASDGRQTLLDLVDRKVSVPVPLLAVIIAVILLLVATR